MAGEKMGVREMVMRVMSLALSRAEKELEDRLKPYLTGDKELETKHQIEIQKMVGDISNMYQAFTNMEKSFRDSIAAAARNTT